MQFLPMFSDFDMLTTRCQKMGSKQKEGDKQRELSYRETSPSRLRFLHGQPFDGRVRLRCLSLSPYALETGWFPA